MKFTAFFSHRLCWINLPGALLIALLQRTPVLRVLAAGGEYVASTPAGQLMRSAFTVAALGALHSRAGATTYVQNPATNPVVGTVGTQLSVAFTYTGTPSPPQRFVITGQLPPGLFFTPAPISGVVRSGNPVISGTPTEAGNYTVRVQGFGTGGNGSPVPINFAISGTTTQAPAFTVQPQGRAVSIGDSITLTASASGTPAPLYQWRRNGDPIASATSATLTLANVQLRDAGEYSVIATNSAGTATSATATVTVTVTTDPNARLTNLSVRTALGADQVLIVGVVVNDGSRNILVRAAGPALAGFGLPTAMQNPRLELYDRLALVLSNDDWPANLASTFVSVGAFPFAPSSRDAAFVQPISGPYSIQARGTAGGVVLVEAYDTDGTAGARLGNVSARNRVGTGDDVLIAGFNIQGAGPKQLLIRAVGPKLAAFGVGGVLNDPKLEIYDSTGAKVVENDNWSAALAATFTMVGAFELDSGSRDAALIVALAPGSYTAHVRGADGGTGEALIEIYEAP